MVFMVGVHFMLPHLINTRPVKERIVAAARAALSGQVDFDTLRLSLFPLPSVKLTLGQLRIHDKVSVRADALTVYPEILPLLAGRVRLRSATVKSPVVEIRLPAGGDGAGAATGVPAVADTSIVRSALARLPHGIHLALTDGDLNLVRQGRSVARFEGVQLTAEHAAGHLRFHMRGRSSLATGFQAEAELADASLDLKGRVKFVGLRTAALEAVFRPGRNTLTAGATLNVQLDFESEALQTLRCAFASDAPAVTVTRGADALRMEGVSLDGDLRLSRGRLQISLAQLKIATPRLNVSGALDWTYKGESQTDRLHLGLQATDSDVTAWRSAMIALAPDLARWKLFEIVRGGTLGRFSFEAGGPSWQSTAKTANMKLSGTAADARIKVPGVDLDLTGVNGEWQLEAGVLDVRQAVARLGATTATGGHLSIGLTGDVHPMALRLDLDADLAQLPPILKKVLPPSAFRDELERIGRLQGSGRGRLLLSGTLADLSVDVAARDIRLTAEYDRLPAPVSVQGGRFRYDRQGITLEGIEADMGDAHVAGLGGLIAIEGTRAARLSVNGTIGENTLQWLHARFKLPADFTPNAPVVVKALDLALQADGQIAIEGGLSLPQGLQVEGRLTVAAGGRAALPSFDLSRLTLADDRSKASITVRHDAGQKLWEGSFDGQLEGATLLKIWQRGPQRTGWVKGRLAVHLPMTDPGRSTVQGALEAGDLILPLESLGTARIHHADLTSGQRKLTLHDLDFSWNLQQLSVRGDIQLTDQGPQLDLTVAAGLLDVGQIEKDVQALKGDAAPADADTAPPKIPVTGRVQIEAAQLVYGNYRWEPVRAAMQIAPDQMVVTVDEANVCGIATLGTLKWSPRGWWLELLPGAAGQTLQFAGGCLTGGRSTERMQGTFNISGRINAGGRDGEALLKQMQGWLKFDAADGRISNAGEVGVLTNILAYLRINRLITGDVPDLKNRDFKFHEILLDLRIRDGKIELKQADVRGETLNLVAEGTVDLSTQTLALTVLVSPLTGIDTLVRHIPVVGKILNGTLIAIPVGVRGPLHDPSVIPLSPRAVGDRIKGILERTLKAPFQLVEPLFESTPAPGNPPAGENEGDSR